MKVFLEKRVDFPCVLFITLGDYFIREKKREEEEEWIEGGPLFGLGRRRPVIAC